MEHRIVTKTVSRTIDEPCFDIQTTVEGDVLPIVDQEEWTTTRKVINHKTRLTETRVQRQIVMEDGKVIADSGPQVSTRTKEDNEQEEVELSSKKGRPPALNGRSPGHGYIRVPGATKVINEKTETRSKTREAKQEQAQYHDEGLRELTGFEVHKKALVSPNALIELQNELQELPLGDRPQGNLIHYSSKGRKTCDKEEMKEIEKINEDGERSVEVTRTMNFEEFDDDEVPEHETIGIQMPEEYRESTKKVQYYFGCPPN